MSGDSPAPPRRDLRGLVARGVLWNGLYQVFSIGVQLASMLLLVRLISPADYGRWGVMLGVLQLINAFSCATFMAQALQLPEGEEPDWTLHWHCGLWIQVGLAATCGCLAGTVTLVPVYADLAPLFGVAALGLLIDAPSRLRATQLHRTLDFRRLRLAGAVSTIASVGASVAIALLGGGALALVVGGNVVASLGFTLDLLVVARWRPAGPWVCWPDWSRYRPALRFGLYQATAGVLRTSRGALAAVVLPGTLGYDAIGLLGRAEALFTATIARLNGMVTEAVYPVLPRCANDDARFHRVASAYVQVGALLLVLGGTFVAHEGPALSSLLYGPKWAAADPLLAPLTLSGMLLGVAALAYRVLLARGRLTACFRVDLVSALLGVGLVLLTFARPDAHDYAWGLTAVAGVVAAGALAAGQKDGLSLVRSLTPPLAAAALGAVALRVGAPLVTDLAPPWRLAATAGAFSLTTAACLRLFFPAFLARILSLVPGGGRVVRALGLRAEST